MSDVHESRPFHALVKRKGLADRDSDNTLLKGVPIDTSEGFVLGEFEVGEVSELLKLVLHLAPDSVIVFSYL